MRGRCAIYTSAARIKENQIYRPILFFISNFPAKSDRFRLVAVAPGVHLRGRLLGLMLLILHLRILPVGRERFGVVLKQEGTRLKRKKLLCALSVCDLIGAVYEGVHISVDLEETKSLALVRYGTPKVLPNDDVPCSPDVCVKVRLCQVRKFWVTNFQAKRRTGGRTGRRACGRAAREVATSS